MTLKIEKLGIIDYQKAYRYQLELVEKVQNSPDKKKYFLLCGHPPVFTRGKGSKQSNILDKDIPVVMTNRGGDLTYHEPGQLVGYIILDLRAEKLTVREHISNIQDMIISSLREIGVESSAKNDLVGVWAGEKKIASIGIGVKKGISMHGFALNVNNDMAGFSRINPCGLDYREMASLKTLTGKPFPFERIESNFIEKSKKTFL